MNKIGSDKLIKLLTSIVPEDWMVAEMFIDIIDADTLREVCEGIKRIPILPDHVFSHKTLWIYIQIIEKYLEACECSE